MHCPPAPQMMPNARVPSNSSPGLNLTHIAKVSTQVRIQVETLIPFHPTIQSDSHSNHSWFWFHFALTAHCLFPDSILHLEYSHSICLIPSHFSSSTDSNSDHFTHPISVPKFIRFYSMSTFPILICMVWCCSSICSLVCPSRMAPAFSRDSTLWKLDLWPTY